MGSAFLGAARLLPSNQFTLFLVVSCLSLFITMFEHFDAFFSLLYERITVFSCLMGALCSTISKYRSSLFYGHATKAKLEYFSKVNQSRSTVTLPQNIPQGTQKLSDLERSRVYGVMQLYIVVFPLVFFAWWRLRVSILTLIMIAGGSGVSYLIGVVCAEISYCGSSPSEHFRKYRRRSVQIANKSQGWILTEEDAMKETQRPRKLRFANEVMVK